MHPVIEDYMITNLKHEAFGVKWGAAFGLRRIGTTRALQPLQDAFRTFHEYWKDHPEQVGRGGNPETHLLESIFRSAIAWGRGWLLDDAALKQLAELCISDACRNATTQDIGRWAERPFRIEVGPADPGYGYHASVVQYRGLQVPDGLKEKLAQFPQGTEFELHVRAAPWDRERISEDIRQYAAATGRVIK
jgi:hypothetical protein